MASKRDAWTRSSWGSLQTLLLTPLNFEIILQILPKSLTQVPMRSLTETYLENIYFLAGLGGNKGQQRKGMQGRKSYVMKFLVDFALYTVYLWKIQVYWLFWEGQSQHRRGCQDTSPMSWSSWVTLFWKHVKQHGFAGRQSSAAKKKKSLFDVPGSFCSRNVW